MSDSEDSIDWLASDEDDDHGDHGDRDDHNDCDNHHDDHGNRGTKTLSPERAARPPSPSSSSSSSSSLRESPTSVLHCGARKRRKRRRRRKSYCSSDCADGGGSPPAAASPVRGFTSVDARRPLVAGATRRLPGKRAHDGGWDGLCGEPHTHTENQLFSQKCSELQRFVQPLASILRGLRSGRYSQRLSSFQESVAVDRIQRIMGVLQNPDSGGRFLAIILKIEEMLNSWFPHVRAAVSHGDDAPAKKLKQHHCSASSPPPPPPPPPPPSSLLPLCSSFSSSTHLRWLHTSPICSLRTPQSTLGPHASSSSSSSSSLLARCSEEATQDNAVSSSTDRPRRRDPRHLRPPPPPFKIRSPCLERLLLAKESIIAPRVAADGGWASS